jgi:hypothetical protein
MNLQNNWSTIAALFCSLATSLALVASRLAALLASFWVFFLVSLAGIIQIMDHVITEWVLLYFEHNTEPTSGIINLMKNT